jgi:hypothetical protein
MRVLLAPLSLCFGITLCHCELLACLRMVRIPDDPAPACGDGMLSWQNSVPTQGVFQGSGGQFMGGSAPLNPMLSMQRSMGPSRGESYPTNAYMNSAYGGMRQLQRSSTGTRITPLAGMSTPQFMGATPIQAQQVPSSLASSSAL